MEKIRMEQTELSYSTHSFSGRSLAYYIRLVEKILLVKRATCLAHRRVGELSNEVCDQIDQACIHILSNLDSYAPSLISDPWQGGGGIAIHNNLNELIAKVANDSYGGDLKISEDINKSQSTVDVLYTSFNLTFIELVDQLKDVLGVTCALLKEKSELWHDVPMVSRTCLQKASETQLSTWTEGMHQALSIQLEELSTLSERLQNVNIGSTVIGQGHGASHEYRTIICSSLSEVTGLTVTEDTSLFESAQFGQRFNLISQRLNSLSGLLLKFCKDIRIMVSGEENEIGILKLPELIKGSTFYRGKNNPTVAETLIQASFRTIGRGHSAELALMHGELNLNVFSFFAGLCAYDSLEEMNRSINNFNQYCLQGLDVHESRKRKL